MASTASPRPIENQSTEYFARSCRLRTRCTMNAITAAASTMMRM